MPSIGEQFKKAREALGLSVAEVAEKTRIKPTHITAMERNDFSVLASPVYARGFIKLYAECLDLDPAPLLDAYRAHVQPEVRPSLQAEEPTSGSQRREPLADVLRRGFDRGRDVLRDITGRLDRRALVRSLGWALGAVAAILLLVGAGRAVRALRMRPPRPRPEAADDMSTRFKGEFRRVELPAEPYIDSDAFGADGDQGGVR